MTFTNILTRSWVGRQRFWVSQLVYLAASTLFLLGFLQLPVNQDWLTHTIQRFYKQQQLVGEQDDVPFRQRKEYGNAYMYTTLILKHCKSIDYFLIPPQRYLIRNAYRQGITDGFAWVYPSVLYYHLGQSIHLVELTAPDSLVQRATYTFLANHDTLSLVNLTAQNRDSVLADFRRYDPHFFAYTPEQARAYYLLKP